MTDKIRESLTCCFADSDDLISQPLSNDCGVRDTSEFVGHAASERIQSHRDDGHRFNEGVFHLVDFHELSLTSIVLELGLSVLLLQEGTLSVEHLRGLSAEL